MIFTKLAVAGAAAVALLAGLSLGGLGGAWYGKRVGAEEQLGRAARSQVQDLNALIESHRGLIAAAAAAGKSMRLATDRRAAADAQSTKELRDALAETSDVRVDCVFDAGVMRQLTEARDRAAAAAAGGVLGALPAAGAASEPQR